MGINGIERRLERLVEGVFSRAFRTGLRPVEIGRRLTRDMRSHLTLGLDGRPVAPNHFVVHLSATDHGRLGGLGASLRRELADAAREEASGEGWTFMGPVQVEMALDDRLTTGRFTVRSELREAPGGASFGNLVEPNGRRHELGSRTYTLGRLPGCDLQLTHPDVSRKHAELRPVEGGWVLVDLASMNGTRINGSPISAQRLDDGDEIGLGRHVMRFEVS